MAAPQQPTAARPRRPRRAALLVGTCVVVHALLAWRFDWVCDDAYISFRYARNLAHGLGPVYNPLRPPPVEGYSNFLWVVWLALFERLGIDVVAVARLSSALCSALLVGWIARFSARRFDSDAAGLGAGLFAATLPSMAVWATGGLAAAPLALAVFGTYATLLGDQERPRGIAAGGLALAAGLLRADGAAFAALALAAGALVWLRRGREARLGRALAVATVVLVAGVGTHVAWRLAYYGDWLPNTARVKAGFSPARLARGLDYVVAWGLAVPSLPLALLTGVRRWRGGPADVGVPVLVVVAGTLAYAVWVGGDFMPFGRFVLPCVPFVALLLAAALAALLRAGRSGPALGLAALCVGLSLSSAFELDAVPASWRERFHFRRDRRFQGEVAQWREMKTNREKMELLGRALARATTPGESIVLGGTGATGYYCDLTVFDKYGLVTPEVVRRGEVRPDASPGHDLRVQESFFFPYRPTYWGALLAPQGSPIDWGLPGPHDPWRKVASVEEHPLDPAEGFPPDTVLRLVRFHWDK